MRDAAPCLTLPKCLRILPILWDTSTTANSGIHSPFGSAPPPGPSIPNSSTSSEERCYRHTSTGVRRSRTAHTSTSVGSVGTLGLVSARPALTTPLSLGPRNGFPAASSAEDTIKSPRLCQEPPVPTPTPRSRPTPGNACSSDFVSPPHTLDAVSRDSQGAPSRASRRHVYPPRASSQPTFTPHVFGEYNRLTHALPDDVPYIIPFSPPLHPEPLQNSFFFWIIPLFCPSSILRRSP